MGMPENQARALADELPSNKNTALDTLVREEFGVDPDELGGSPWAAATASFFLFSAGAIFPLLPFFFVSGPTAILGEPRPERRGLDRDRCGNVPVHRTEPAILRDASIDHRLCGGCGHLRGRATSGGRARLAVRQAQGNESVRFL